MTFGVNLRLEEVLNGSVCSSAFQSQWAHNTHAYAWGSLRNFARFYNALMRCRGCNYPLAGRTEHCCPECGRGFDPNDATTFLSKGRIAGEIVFWRFLLVACATPLVLLAMLWLLVAIF